MAASIETTGLDVFAASLRRAASGGIQKELVTHLHKEGPLVVREMQGSAFTRIQKQAASTVGQRRLSDGVEFAGGRGGGLGATLFDGGEYGGRKPKKVTYATRSPRGKAYVVSRRTTMQFLPHLGREGYFYWPTVRDWMKRLIKDQEDLFDRALGGR